MIFDNFPLCITEILSLNFNNSSVSVDINIIDLFCSFIKTNENQYNYKIDIGDYSVKWTNKLPGDISNSI